MNGMFVIRPNADRFRESSRAMQAKFSFVGFGFKTFNYFGAKLWNVYSLLLWNNQNICSF